ncbi:MAG: ThiF family adenylyltransferase [Planctomycetes bacterium]|jgi:adenylyltransferase/sulfurtransferase|nr:ThiF family adenylyltransferase [Planctomycetota bacterium]
MARKQKTPAATGPAPSGSGAEPFPHEGRYAAQERFPALGGGGQARLGRATVLVVGCGALGCASSQLLVRAGVGCVRLADRDLVEPGNLHRQLLFDERDALERLPKAEAAARRLRSINSAVRVEATVAHVGRREIGALAAGADLVVDGTDNLETRFLINDFSLKSGVPWIYAGAVAASAMVLPVLPGRGPCLRCLIPDLPPPGTFPTCDTAGVLNAAPSAAASLQAALALRILSGDPPAPSLAVLDLWAPSLRTVAVSRNPSCPACAGGRLEFLEGDRLSSAQALCGRDGVQIVPSAPAAVDLEALAGRLRDAGGVSRNAFLLVFRTGPHELTVFPDGRVIVKGTADPGAARTLAAKWLGM